MPEDHRLWSVAMFVISFLWVLVDFVIAGLAIWRFRNSVTTWLVAGGFVGFAFVRVISGLFNWLIAPGLELAGMHYLVSTMAFQFCYVCLSLIVAGGIAFIPRSLRKLGARG